jgi:hypothetical protein
MGRKRYQHASVGASNQRTDPKKESADYLQNPVRMPTPPFFEGHSHMVLGFTVMVAPKIVNADPKRYISTIAVLYVNGYI